MTVPGAAIDAFRRDLGMTNGADAGPREAAAKRPGLGPIDAGTRTAFAAELVAARRLLATAMAKGRDIDDLPSGKGRVERLARGIGLLGFRRPALAEELLRGLVEEERRYFPAWEYLAQAQLRQRRAGEAEKVWRSLCQALPGETRYRFQLTDVLFLQREPAKTAEAIRILDGMVDGSDGVRAASRLANRFLNLYRASEAEAVLRQAAKSRPANRELQFRIGQALRYQGKHDEAIGALAPVADSPGPYQDRAIFEIAWSHRALMQSDAALARLDDLARGNFKEFVDRLGAVLPQLRADLGREKQLGRRVTFSPYELRHHLRESEEAAMRGRALAILAANVKQVPGVEDDFRFVLEKDPDPDLRRDAMLALRRVQPQDVEPVLKLLADASPRNRKLAAGQLGAFGPQVAKARLFAALEREQDPSAFVYLHGLLERLAEESFFLESGAANDESGRKRVRAQWAERLGMTTKEKSGK